MTHVQSWCLLSRTIAFLMFSLPFRLHLRCLKSLIYLCNHGTCTVNYFIPQIWTFGEISPNLLFVLKSFYSSYTLPSSEISAFSEFWSQSTYFFHRFHSWWQSRSDNTHISGPSKKFRVLVKLNQVMISLIGSSVITFICGYFLMSCFVCPQLSPCKVHNSQRSQNK